MSEVRTYLEALMAIDEAPLKLDPGQVIFAAGEPGREMFIVRTGSVDLRIDDALVETVEQGGVFGESHWSIPRRAPRRRSPPAAARWCSCRSTRSTTCCGACPGSAWRSCA